MSRYGPKSSQVISGQSRADSTLGQVELSGRYWVDPSRPRLIWSRLGPCQCLVEPVQAHDNLSLSGLILSLAGSGRYLDDRAGLMLSWVGPGWCWAEQVRVDVEPSGHRPMSRRAGTGRCREERARVDVKPNGPEPISSRTGPGRCRA